MTLAILSSPMLFCYRWLAIRLEFLGNLVIFFSALFAVISREYMYSGLVGLSISYALNVSSFIIHQNWQMAKRQASLKTVPKYLMVFFKSAANASLETRQDTKM